MYRVKIYQGYNDREGITIHSPHMNGQKLLSGVAKDEINKIDTFNFSFSGDNVANGQLRPFLTFIDVLNTLTGEYIFEGRILKPQNEMDNEGLVTYSWLAEGELAYLHDSQQRHYEFRGTPIEGVTVILDYHNNQVDEHQRFEVGNIEVTNNTNNLYFYLSAEQDTFQSLKEKILDALGGEMQIRKENGVRYLDILNRIGEKKETDIMLSKNLISMSQTVDPTDVVTRLTPLGTRIETEDEDATDASQARLTIESVNNGLPFIDRPDLIAQFGYQGGSYTWDDITLPENLLNAGRQRINNQRLVLNQYQVDAYDLSVIGLTIDSFKKGNSHRLINPVMHIDEVLRIVGTSKDIINVDKSGITIGDKFKSTYEYQADANRNFAKVAQLQSELNSVNRKVNEQVRTINKKIVVINKTLDEGDLPSLVESINDLQDAIIDLNIIVEGIPSYGLARPDYSGLMPMGDKQKVDYLTVTEETNLDLMRNKLSLLTLDEEVDLNNLVAEFNTLKQKVEDLEQEETE